MKSVVVYRSQTGFTNRYGKWLSEELYCPLLDIKDIKEPLSEYDRVIFGRPLFADKIMGLEELKRVLKEGTKTYLFTTGISEISEERISAIKKNLPQDFKDADLFYFPGGFDFKRLNFINKLIIRILRATLKNKQDEESKRVYKIMKDGADLSNKEYILPMISKLRLE